jgi:hypothetical protein
VPRPDLMLSAIAGGYLRNPVRVARKTCADCLTPVDGYELCFSCRGHHARPGVRPGVADALAFLTYAVADQKSGHVMRGYKAPRPVTEHRQVVALLLLVALENHTRCAEILVGRPVTHWAVVPSLPAKPSIHPLRGLVADRAKGIEVPLVAAAGVQQPRAINPDHFTCDSRLPRGSHVLLIDDTWATGGHIQSAVLSLRRAGAARVSALVVARWLKGNYGDNKSFIAGLADRDYNPLICPWTGGGCPETLVELVVDFIGLRA